MNIKNYERRGVWVGAGSEGQKSSVGQILSIFSSNKRVGKKCVKI